MARMGATSADRYTPVIAWHSRGEALSAGRWHGFMTAWVSADLLDPMMSTFTGIACDKASFGWPCGAKLGGLRDAFARTTDPARRRALAEAIQVRISEFPTYAQLGQYNSPSARRASLSGEPRGAHTGVLEHQEKGLTAADLRLQAIQCRSMRGGMRPRRRPNSTTRLRRPGTHLCLPEPSWRSDASTTESAVAQRKAGIAARRDPL